MILTRCSDQRGTLEEFYQDLATLSESRWDQQRGEAMLSLIRHLKAEPDQRVVFGLTSHSWLVLLAEDVFDSPRYVTIASAGVENYRIEYMMRADDSPWAGYAHVAGEAISEDQAVKMVYIAMEKSGGWLGQGA